jgi:hypothetical protein
MSRMRLRIIVEGYRVILTLGFMKDLRRKNKENCLHGMEGGKVHPSGIEKHRHFPGLCPAAFGAPVAIVL